MTFEELLDQVLALLQRRGRVAYRAVQRQFDLDNATFEDVKDALLFAHPELVADEGRGLVWTGATGPTHTPTASPPDAMPPPAAERIGIPKGILRWRSPSAIRQRPCLAHGVCCALRAVWQPRWCVAAQGVERHRAVWTRAAGGGRARLIGVPRGEGLGKGGWESGRIWAESHALGIGGYSSQGTYQHADPRGT